MALDTWLVYLAAAIGLSLSPGPNGLLALTHGALHGWRRALATIVGGALGFVVVIAVSLFGVGALVQASPGALAAMKWVGGAYLAWLGVQVWRAAPVGHDLDTAERAPGSVGAMARQGFLSAVTNPKGLLFFVAFLPQFVDPARALASQFAVMAGTFAVVEILTELLLAAGAHRLRPWLARVGARFNQVCGAIFILLGAGLPLRG
jgi:threonine/homoserine/homoserine lactone efflux protein